MDLDFLLTSIVYLLIIFTAHFYLKLNESKPVLVSNVSSEKIEEDSKVNTDTKQFNTDKDLIINENELHAIQSNVANDDFMKYLNVEQNDTESTYTTVTKAPETANNNIDIGSAKSHTELDKYFSDIKEEQYIFEPVPTPEEHNYNEDVLQKSPILNQNNINNNNVFAFDDFDSNYSPI